MAQAHRIPSAWHDVVEEPQKISQAGRISFVWSRAKIRIAGLVLFAAATPAAAGITVSVPFVKWLCLAWLLGVALLMHGLSRRAADDTVVLSLDQRGILDRRLMPRHIKWQEIEAICPVDTNRSHTVDIRLRWPRTTLEHTRWSGPHRYPLPDRIRRTGGHDQHAAARWQCLRAAGRGGRISARPAALHQ